MYSKSLNNLYGQKPSVQILILLFLYFFILSCISHIFGLRIFAFALLPLPFLILKTDISTILGWFFLNLIALYEPQKVTSNLSVLYIPDILLFLFLGYSIILRQRLFEIRISYSPMLLILCSFLLYCLSMSIVPLVTMGFDYFLIRDIRDFLILGLSLFLVWHPAFTIKKSYLLLLAIIFSTTLLSIKFIVQYAIEAKRIISWNEIYIADAIILGTILLPAFKKKSVRIFLILSLIINSVCLLFVQTRSLWLSVASSFFLIAFFMLRSRLAAIKLKNLMRIIINTGLITVMIIIFVNLFFNINPIDFVQKRFFSFKKGELIDPTSSLGYRVYESYMVWRNKTVLGHGAGARLHLVSLQYVNNHKWHHWWSIHSEYFELLHKYGFVGITLFGIFLILYFYNSYRISQSPKKNVKYIGISCFTVMLSHCVISITSGYITRDNVTPFLFCLIILAQRYSSYSKRKHA